MGTKQLNNNEELTDILRDGPIRISGREALKDALYRLDAATTTEIQGNGLEVWYVHHLDDSGYTCIRAASMQEKTSVWRRVPFHKIPEQYRNQVLATGFFLVSGYKVLVPSSTAVTQLSKQLMMGAGGDILRVGAGWLETSLFLQRAIMETSRKWKAVIRTEGGIGRMSAILSKNTPDHDFSLCRALLMECTDAEGDIGEQSVRFILRHNGKVVTVQDSVTGQCALRAEGPDGFAYVRDHRTKISVQEAETWRNAVHNILYKRDQQTIPRQSPVSSSSGRRACRAANDRRTKHRM
jgi:hypothetical protein